jgi:hypothetical protein
MFLAFHYRSRSRQRFHAGLLSDQMPGSYHETPREYGLIFLDGPFEDHVRSKNKPQKSIPGLSMYETGDLAETGGLGVHGQTDGVRFLFGIATKALRHDSGGVPVEKAYSRD